MRILVTGGAGFIGANLCRELVRRPDISAVTVLDNLSTGSAANLDGVPVDLVIGSLLDRGLLTKLVGLADAVIHLAARPSVTRSLEDPMASHEANATGTLCLLEACRANGTYVVGASSSSVYGSVNVLPKHEDLPTRPVSPYAASKLATEAYLLAYRAAFGVPTLPLRFFNVYGPLQSSGHAYAAVIPTFMDAALRGIPLRVHGDGTQSRDFTYVGSVARVLADAAVRRVVAGTPLNLAFGRRITIMELTERLRALLPDRELVVEYGPARPGDVAHSQADSARLVALFPSAVPVSMGEGLARTIEWFRTLPQYAEKRPTEVSGTSHGASFPAPTPATVPSCVSTSC